MQNSANLDFLVSPAGQFSETNVCSHSLGRLVEDFMSGASDENIVFNADTPPSGKVNAGSTVTIMPGSSTAEAMGRIRGSSMNIQPQTVSRSVIEVLSEAVLRQ